MTRAKKTPGSTAAVILAAGQGKRMRSKLPKVLHCVGGVPMVAHVVDLCLARRADPVVVVVDPEGKRVREALSARYPKANLVFAVQKEALGTGDALRVGLEAIPDFHGRAMVLCGDVPLLQGNTLKRLATAGRGMDVAVLSAELTEPTGYGRVVRDGKKVLKIVEEKDASADEKMITEINSGTYLLETKFAREALKKLETNNAQGELYLTDLVEMAADGGKTTAVVASDSAEISGINDRFQLAEAEVVFRHRRVLDLMAHGVTFMDPNCTFIDADVVIERDVVLGVGVQIYGRTRIGMGARIDGPTVIKNSSIAAGAQVNAFSHLEDAKVGKHAKVGPYGRLRPGAELAEDARVGNFVEVKKAKLGKGAKANHLAYIGDADVGPQSNVGAGTITCNYDGKNKHKTTLGKGVFVGSNSTLVAPVSIAAGSYVAAGSTVTQDVERDSLVFGRSRQVVRKGYAKRLKDKIKKGKSEE